MFQIEVNQNPFVVKGTTRMEAVLTVTAAPDLKAPSGPAVLGLVLDGSGSMKGAVHEQAKAAAKRAIALLDGQAYFFVVAFATTAEAVVPLALATQANKNAAARAVDALEAEGGTMFSRALARAREEVAKASPDARAHVLFLTDGKNNTEDKACFPDELARCEGAFQADCRGVGTDWEPAQLREIADRLLGTARIVADASGLEADFKESMARALGRGVGNVRVRLALPKSGKVRTLFVKQTSPQILDLTAQGSLVEAQTTDFATGAWGPGETRDFHVGFEVATTEGAAATNAPGQVGDEMMLCRPSVVFGRAEQLARGRPVLLAWTQPGDERSALINSHVAHYTGQVKLAQDIQQGLALRARGDHEQATVFLGRALAGARSSGNAAATAKLQEIVVEEQDGTIRLKPNVAKATVMDLDLASVVTARAPRRDVS